MLSAVRGIVVSAGLTCLAAFAQSPNIIAGPTVDETLSSHTSVLISFTTDQPLTSDFIECGLPGNPKSIKASMAGDGAARRVRMNGLKPATAYECVVGGATTSGETVISLPITFTTAPAPENRWEPIPDPPLPDIGVPEINGNTYGVTDCADLQPALDSAAGADPNLTHEIIIEKSLKCVGNFVVRNHPGPGWILIRGSQVGSTTFPPAGVRLDPSVYSREMPRLRTPKKWGTVSFQNSDAAFSIADRSGYVRLTGVILEAEPTYDNLVSRAAVCAPVPGADVACTIGNGVNHNLQTGRTVVVSGNTSIPGLDGTRTITSTGDKTFTLDGTSHLTGSSGNTVIAILGDFALTACTATSPIVCDTAVPHGLVNGDLVKIYGTDSLEGLTGTHAVTVTGPQQISLNGSTGNGTYSGYARAVHDAPNYFYLFASSATSSHIVLDRVWIHHWGFPWKASFGVRFESNDSAIIESHIDANSQWRLVKPGTTAAAGMFSVGASGYSINIQNAKRNILFRNNYIGFQLLGLFADSNNNAGSDPQTNTTVVRNTFEIPESFRKSTSNPVWDGLAHDGNRQGLEWKHLTNGLIRGNQFLRNWKDQDGGCALILSPRYGNSPKNRISNVLIEYNTIYPNSHGCGFKIAGGETMDQAREVPIGSRITIRHNVIGVNGLDNQYAGQTGVGICAYLAWGLEDVVFDHNLCLNQRGTQQSMLFFGSKPNAGMKIRNNIFTYQFVGGPISPIWFYTDPERVNSPDTSLFQSLRDDGWNNWRAAAMALGDVSTGTLHLDPDSEFRNNVMIAGVKGYSGKCDDDDSPGCNCSAAECTAFLGLNLAASNLCWGPRGRDFDTLTKRITAAGFENPAAHKYRLQSFSPFSRNSMSSSTLCIDDSAQCIRATEGADMGPDIDALEAAQGRVKDAALVDVTSFSAAIVYVAPDTDACHLDISNAPLPTGPVIRINDGGGSRERRVTIGDGGPADVYGRPQTPLQPGTEYHFRLQCAVEQYSGTFRTQ